MPRALLELEVLRSNQKDEFFKEYFMWNSRYYANVSSAVEFQR